MAQKMARTENVKHSDKGQAVRPLPKGGVDHRHDPQKQRLTPHAWRTVDDKRAIQRKTIQCKVDRKGGGDKRAIQRKATTGDCEDRRDTRGEQAATCVRAFSSHYSVIYTERHHHHHQHTQHPKIGINNQDPCIPSGERSTEENKKKQDRSGSGSGVLSLYMAVVV